MRASTWPCSTLSLKSTSTSVTCPEIWLPTTTVEIALRVPVAEIATRMSPSSTSTVRQAPASADALRWLKYQAPAPSARMAMTMETRVFRGRLARLGRWLISLRDPAGVVEANAPVWPALTCSVLACCRKAENDVGALAERALDMHRPAVARRQAPPDGQAQAPSADVLVGAVEGLEDALKHVARHADPGIADFDTVVLHTDLDAARRSEGAGIAHQLLEDHRHRAPRAAQRGRGVLDQRNADGRLFDEFADQRLA